MKDFDGDGRADILWRHTSGYNAMWMLDGLSIKRSAVVGGAAPNYKVQPEIPQ